MDGSGSGQHPPGLVLRDVRFAWLEDGFAARLVARLTPYGEVRFVGGCVRDAMIARAAPDIDLATALRPDQVLSILAEAGVFCRAVGRAFGVVLALPGSGEPGAGAPRVEIATLRRDVRSLDGRHPVVEYGVSWPEDAARRDLTINAMSLDVAGGLYDYHGGLADLQAGRVRFIGDAKRRIAEDHLRILRYLRFWATYGRGDPDSVALVALADAHRRVTLLSAERIRSELSRLLVLPDPVPALVWMERLGILPQILKTARQQTAFAELSELIMLEVGEDRPEWLRRLACLVVPGTEAAIASALRLSRAEAKRLRALCTLIGPGRPEDTIGAPVMARRLYTASERVDRLLLGWARSRAVDGRVSDGEWRAALARSSLLCRARVPVDGNDVLALGVAAGPPCRVVLERIRCWWFNQDGHPDRSACLAQLGAWVVDGSAPDG